MRYFYIFFASSIVSGSLFPYVSGLNSTKIDDKMAVAPKSKFGIEAD